MRWEDSSGLELCKKKFRKLCLQARRPQRRLLPPSSSRGQRDQGGGREEDKTERCIKGKQRLDAACIPVYSNHLGGGKAAVFFKWNTPPFLLPRSSPLPVAPFPHSITQQNCCSICGWDPRIRHEKGTESKKSSLILRNKTKSKARRKPHPFGKRIRILREKMVELQHLK